MGKSCGAPLNFNAPKKTKAPKLISMSQAYSHVYYEDVVKPLAIQQWPAEQATIVKAQQSDPEQKDSKPPPEHPPIWFINKLTSTKFNEVSDPAVLNKLEQYCQGLIKEEATEPMLDDGDGDGEDDKEESESPEEVEERERVEGAIEFARLVFRLQILYHNSS